MYDLLSKFAAKLLLFFELCKNFGTKYKFYLCMSKKSCTFAGYLLKIHKTHIMKKVFLFLVLIVALSAQAVLAVTTSYYSGLDGKSGSTLYSAINSVCQTGYNGLTYKGVWTAYETTDTKSDGTTIWDMYSGVTNYTYSTNQCGNYSGEGDCYNREHSIPKSWFGQSNDPVSNSPGTDLFHVVATDGYVNSMRSNYAFGEVSSATYTSQSGCKLGTAKSITISNTMINLSGSTTQSCSTSTVFEPMDEFKGDFARGYFGTLLKWEANSTYNNFAQESPGAAMFQTSFDAAHYYGLTGYSVALLLKWHREDPVSPKEIDRNNGIQSTQGNRNPFIDYPILAEYIWGKYAGETFSRDNAVGSFEAGFTPGVSDGDKSSTPVVPYNVLWMADGSQHATQATLPANPDNCSSSRVFVGWTSQSSVSARPEDLFTTQPTITKDTTFYAVYANASTGSGTSTSDSVTYSSVYSEDTEVEGDTLSIGSDISVVFKKGSSATKYYKSGTAIRWYGGGTCTIASSAGNITQIVLTYGSSDGSNEITSNVGTFSTNTWTGSADTVVFTQAGTSGQRRIVKIKVTYGGGTSYTNYSLSCSTPTPTPTPSTLPEYMAPPAGYYNSIEGLQDSLLKSTLGTLSNTGTRLKYGNGSKNRTWYGFYFTDRDTTDNSVIDMYSYNKRYFSTEDSTASVDGCHIEHMLPKSWWGGDDNDAYKDLYHLVPSDGQANTSKNNWGPGVPDMSYASAFDNGKFYTSRDTIHNLTRCFAPSDEYKGDFARAYFYVVTTYGDQFTWVQSALDAGMTNDSYMEFQDWLAELLMEWHRLDPVSEKEVRRAYEVNKIQSNRNPFIDYPCLAEYIWGNHKGEVVSMSSLVSGYEGMGTDCCGGGTPATKYTITWSVNGETSSDKVTEGEKSTAPSVSPCVSTRPFMGWTTSSSFTGVPSPLYASNAIPNAAEDATYYAIYADKSIGSGTVTDSLTYSTTGIGVLESGSATYADFSGASVTSDAVYAGNINKFTKNSNPNYIQLKSNGSTSGIITTTSGGTATKVRVAWNSGTADGRTLDVYGKTTAYSAASDLYDNSAKGTKIGSIVYGTSTELTISGNYTYIGLRSNSGAMYLDTIAVTWSTGNVTTYDNYSTQCLTCTPEAPEISFASAEKSTTCGGSVSNALDKGGSEGAVTYSSTNTSVATVNASTGAVTVISAGSTIITADIVKDGCYTAASTSYTLTVNKTDVTASFNNPTTSIQEGQTATSVVTTNSEGTVTYSSNNTSVATVNASTGQVSAVAPGTARITATIEATNCQNGNSAYYDLTVTAIPTYTVTWKAGGSIVAIETVQQGNRSPMPADPSCSERVFMGWSVQKNYKDEKDAPDDLFTLALLSPIITQDTTIYAVYADETTTPRTTTVTDTLTRGLIGITGNYDSWTGKTATSAAVYAGNSAGGNSAIQLRGSNDAGIISTTSGGTLKNIKLVWNSSTNYTRELNIYGKNAAYTTTKELYSTNADSLGTALGSMKYGTTSLDITGSYKYVGLRPKSNAIYLDSILISWSIPSGKFDTTYINYSTICEPFMAFDASEITTNSFVANWAEAGVDSYSLDVMTAQEGLVPQDTTFYSKDFIASLDGWTINNVSGYESVWTHSTNYGAYATSYVSSVRNEAESWLISPSIDLSEALSATLTLNNVFRYASTVSLMISSDGGTNWSALSPSNWSAASSWDFVDSEASLASYKGQTIKIGLKYIGTTDACPTWEVKTLTISGTANKPSTIHQSIYSYPQNVIGTSVLVNGLDPETTYYYTVTPAGGSASNEITVTTLKNSIPTDTENPSEAIKARKVLINNQLFIIRGEKVYTIQGLQIQ